MAPDLLLARIEAIRFPIRELAIAANKPADTVARAVGRRADKTDPRTSTLDAIEQALVAEEIRLRDYLVGMHPVANGKVPA